MYAEVIVDIATSEVDRIFDYDTNSLPVKRGQRVFVSFGKTEVEGFVISLKQTTTCAPDKIKQVKRIIDAEPIITDEMFDLLDYMSTKLHIIKAACLRLFIPAAMRKGRVKELNRLFVRLNADFLDKDILRYIRSTSYAQLELYEHLKSIYPNSQSAADITKSFSNAALNALRQKGIALVESEEVYRVPSPDIQGLAANSELTLTKSQTGAIEAISSTSGETFLLHGVTGSGKTEVYMHVIEKALASDRTAIMLVPEISLTPQVLRNFRNRFGEKVALLHSGLSKGERFDEWRKCLSGEAKVVIGPRSAIFAPLKNVGLIIMDEEHDSSYVSESSPRYSTYEIAEWRKKYNNANLILGSATPSVETYYKTETKEIKLLTMPERVNGRPLPDIEVIDMRKEYISGNTSIISRALEKELSECINNGNQAMLFLNRRGYASFMMCKRCGYIPKCDMCDVSLVYHKEEGLLKCHYCGRSFTHIDSCPSCGCSFIKEGYVGTEKVAEMLNRMFPGAGVLRMDNDTTRTKGAHESILTRFGEKKASILVGTQMIAKGHDFPLVTLVGILDADMSLHMNDYRSVERTFQLSTQVAGRAGRAQKRGKVILQTYSPQHYVFRYIKDNDYDSFYKKEINLRQVTKYPPYSKIIRVLVSGPDDKKAAAVLKSIYEKISSIKNEKPNLFEYFSYMRSPLKKLQGEFRMQILIRLVGECEDIAGKVYDIVDECRVSGITSYAEINPIKLS
ncbi:MAG: primosomal protein N' [Clostridia bacterium]|nr:primosomal protein N' [Clostridia bacterium]